MKRFFSILLAVCLLATCVPMDTYAMVGALNTTTEAVSADSNGASVGTYKVRWIQNDHIRLYVVTNRVDKETYLVTVPARTKASAKEACDMVRQKGIYQKPYFTAGSKSVRYSTRDVSVSNDAITVKYVLKPYEQISGLEKNSYVVTTTYRIVKLDEGTTAGTTGAGRIYEDDADSGRTYGIKTSIDATYQGSPVSSWKDTVDLKFFTELHHFNKMGHANASKGASIYMSSASGSSKDGYTHTEEAVAVDMLHVNTGSVGWAYSAITGQYKSHGEAISELFTKGYSWANPFTAMSPLYTGYVDGHAGDPDADCRDSLPEQFSATVSGNVTLECPFNMLGKERSFYYGNMLWGFRDLYTDKEEFTPSDKVEVSTTAKQLGIYQTGKTYQAVPAENAAALEKNKETYGEPVAVLRGNYAEKNGRYVFSSGAAALSATITATWPMGSGSFSVGKDGSFEINGVSLNAPTFKFYQEKSSGQDGLSIAPGADGLAVAIDADTNAAVMTTDVPGTTIRVESAMIKPSGNISFAGNAQFAIFRGAEFTMQELGYGMKNDKFKVNGIRATGKIDTADMLGLEMASLEGTIDTFNSYYHFTMELNVFDLFETNAELELMRSDLTGSLMPNKLYFFAGSSVAKIPLVPPVVVANITGAGGGFDGLAKTLNGDFFAIPPLTLSITGRGEVLNVIEAKATYTFRPGYYKLEAEDVGIAFLKKLNLIDNFTIYEGIQGETRNHKGTNYTGLSASGGASIHISVPNKSKIIQAQGDVNASAFAGLDNYKNPTKVYAVADLSGGARGSLHLPKNWKFIGGLSLGSTGFDFYLGADTVVPVRGTDFNGAVNAAFKNFRAYGGAKKEGDWEVCSYRVWYIFPENDAGFKVVGFWSDLPEWKWEDHKPEGYSASVGEEDALAAVEVNLEPLETVVTEAQNNADESAGAETVQEELQNSSVENAGAARTQEETQKIVAAEAGQQDADVENAQSAQVETQKAVAEELAQMDAQNTAVTENAQTESEKTGSNSAQAEPQTELVTEPAQEEMQAADAQEIQPENAESAATEGSTGTDAAEDSSSDSYIIEDTLPAVMAEPNAIYSKDVRLDAHAGQTLPSDATVLLMVTPIAEDADMDAFAQSLSVEKNGSGIALTWPQYNEEKEIINESEVNALITTNGDGKPCVMIGLGQNASVDDICSVTSSLSDYRVSMNASLPFDSLSVSLHGQTLSGQVANPDASAKYVLATYFGEESGDTTYVIDHQDITDPSDISAEIPSEGTMLPTGSYFVTAKLLSKVEVEIENEDGTKGKEEVLLPVDTAELGQVQYRNAVQPAAPASADIQPAGNEIMQAAWSQVDNADGYKVTIYQEDGGNFVDTGKGYMYDAEDIKASKINGIRYDADTKTFVLDMALTVAGEDVIADEEKNTTSKETTSVLEAGKNYKIGVQAYNYLKDETGDRIDNSNVYSEEKLSNASLLPKYTPLDLDVKFEIQKQGESSSELVSQTVTEENGVFSCVSGAGADDKWYLTLSNKTGENAAYTLTRTDTDTEYPAVGEGKFEIDNADITGSIMVRMDAKVDKGRYTDTTTKYLLIEKDETAPMISLDDSIVYADAKTGEYTITGIAEPNSAIYRINLWGGTLEEKIADADENGKFSYTGKLELTMDQYVFDENGEFVLDENGDPVLETVAVETGEKISLLAADGNGNWSDTVAAFVTLADHDWEDDYTIDEEPTCSTEGSKSIHCKTCEATKDSQVIPVTTHNFEKEPVAYTAPTATQNGSATYRCAVCQETKTIEIPAVELTVGESVKKLSDVTFGIEGWSCDDSQVLQPGTVVDAVAKYRLTENLTITANVRIKVSCSATSAVHKSGTSDPAVIRCTGVLEAFQGLTVDGKTLTNGKEYTAESGSTILTFTADYLNTLTVGTHTVVLAYDAGEARARLLITEDGNSGAGDNSHTGNSGSGSSQGDPSGTAKTPDTGDHSPVLWWMLLLILSAGSVIALVIFGRRRNRKRR